MPKVLQKNLLSCKNGDVKKNSKRQVDRRREKYLTSPLLSLSLEAHARREPMSVEKQLRLRYYFLIAGKNPRAYLNCFNKFKYQIKKNLKRINLFELMVFIFLIFFQTNVTILHTFYFYY